MPTAPSGSSRCVVLLGVAAPMLVRPIVDHLTDAHLEHATVLEVLCRPEDAKSRHSVLRRLFDRPEPASALAHLTGQLTAAPLVLAIVDVHHCDDATLRFLDHVLRRAAGEPLTVLMTMPRGVRAVAGAAFHDLVSRRWCSVVDVSDLSVAGVPAATDVDAAAGCEPHLPAVLRAVAVLRHTDADLVASVADLPVRLVNGVLATAHALGAIPQPLPPPGTPCRLDATLAALPEAEVERLHAYAARILNDAGWPAAQVADHLLAQSTLDQPWMTAILAEAAATARPIEPAAAVRYLSRLNLLAPDDVAVRLDLATALLDIDPVTARHHLEPALADARPVGVPLALTALMTHQLPDTPAGLDQVLRVLTADGGGPIALATRAVRTALRGTALEEAVADARRALRAGPPSVAWATVAAIRVLALADDTNAALEQSGELVADSQRRQEPWAECHARSARALLLLETGALAEAMAEARAAARLAHGHAWAEQLRLPTIVMAIALVARGQLDRAETVLQRLDGQRFDGSAWEHHHFLMADALAHRARGRTEQALALLEVCGTSLASAGIANPVFSTWWVASTDLLMRVGAKLDAAERAELGRHLASRWPTARSAGLSLLVRSMVAAGADRVELLSESVRELSGCSDRPHHAVAELRLGRALLERDDRKAARVHLHAARTLAEQHGLTALSERARTYLATAGGRSPVGDQPAPDALTDAERPVARLAARGASNREIADALFITVRTVEFHLTNVYRKLAVPGRGELAERLGSTRAPRFKGDGR